MEQFKSNWESHNHSLEILERVYQYDSFLDSLKVICDMGCGAGLDVKWWATLETREDKPEPRNYKVYAVDQVDRLDPEVKELENVIPVIGDFEQRIIPIKVDFIWAHDSLQYALNPLETLKNWSLQMNKDGMLLISVPQNLVMMHNRPIFRAFSHVYHNFSIPSLLYMLAVNGFDCRDAYVRKLPNDDWINIAVYKNSDPMDPKKVGLYELAEKELLHPSAVNSINSFGYMRQEDLIYPWLDRDFYQFRH